MATSTRRRTLFTVLVLLVSVAVVWRATAQPAETPRRGGVLLAVIGADAPSLDPHQEQTFATLQLVAPLYSTLLADRPVQLPEGHRRRGHRVEDLAGRADLHVQDPPGHPVPRRLAADGRRRQGHLRQDRLPAGRGAQHPEERTTRRSRASRRRIPSTVVFKLKFPSASLLDNLASPWNVIFPKKYLDKDPNHFKTNVVGSGPFKFKSYTRGSTFEGERNPDYFVKDRPYLDGYKFFISTETSVRAAAIRSGRAYIEFRDLPLAEVDAIQKQLGDKVVVQDDAGRRPVRHRHQQHGEAVHRRPRPQGPHAGHRSLHGGQGAVPAHRPAGTSAG